MTGIVFGKNITYDEIGNPQNWPGFSNMSWSNGRRLTGLQIVGGLPVGYTYDESGLRVKKNVGSSETFYDRDASGKLVHEKRGSNHLYYYYSEDGSIGSISYNGTRYAFRKNLQGDVMALLDTTGKVVAQYAYDAWGKILSVTDASGNAITSSTHIANINPIRYRGYYYDTETKWYYLNSRYYDPAVRRFINGDNQLAVDNAFTGYNLFAYCGNNPANRYDPSGQFWIPAIIVTAAIAVGLSGCSNSVNHQDGATSSIKYDVPLYKQGNTNLCWAYCQTMIESYQNNTTLNKKEANARAKEIAVDYHGENSDWNKGGWPSNLGECIPSDQINDIDDLYTVLEDNGPVYAYYSNNKSAHMVVLTGVDLGTGMVYTNNPWGVKGAQ